MGREDLLRELFVKYNLHYDPSNPESKDNDVYVHKHYKIITRQGIQKIEKAAGIKCDINIHTSGEYFCNVVGTAVASDGSTYKTLASANSANSKNAYYVEMAEKRCRSRLILTLVGLYELGVFGEDEMDNQSQSKGAVYKGN